MNKNKDLISNFCSSKISLNALYESLKEYDKDDFYNLNKDIESFYSEENEEKLIIICIIISSIFNFDLSNFSSPIHNFISDHIELNNNEIKFICKRENFFLYKKDEIVFIINDTDKIINIDLPIEYQNTTVYCLNCGCEFKTTNTLEVYKHSFYIIEK